VKARKPKFLTPRRKYEVDESKWLVRFGRTQWKALKPLAYRAIRIGRAGAKALHQGGRKVVLFIQWRRMPKDWELSFVTKMRSMEALGIPFPEVLKTNLPSLFGEDTSLVLMRWVGRKSRIQPKHFVKSIEDMFGKSAKVIITTLEGQADPDKMLEVRVEAEPPFQSFIDAIQQADAQRAELEFEEASLG